MSGLRETQTHHPVVEGGGERGGGGVGGSDAGRLGSDRELRRRPEVDQRDEGHERHVPLPDQPVQRVQREAARGTHPAGGAVWVTHTHIKNTQEHTPAEFHQLVQKYSFIQLQEVTATSV